LDMVGEKQELCQGPLVAEYPPHATESFVGDVLAAIMELVAEEAKSLGGTKAYALFKHTTSPFSGGSDHYIFSDPTVGVPCPMLIQWPDKFYHTSADTLDKVDPAMLYRVGCMTATYAYLMANLGFADVPWLLGECRRRYLELTQSLLASAVRTAAPLAEVKEKLDYLLKQRISEMADIGRFVEESSQPAFAKELAQETALLTNLTEQLWQRHLGENKLATESKETAVEYQAIPKRLFKGPMDSRGKMEQLTAAERAEYQAFCKQHAEAARRMPNYLVYRADGQRTVAEIDRLVKLEIGVSDKAFALRYFQLLERLGLAAWVK